MRIYIVIIEDRHSDMEVLPFSSADDAVKFAKKTARAYCRHGKVVAGLNDAMKKDGWLYYGQYSCENDNVRVLERVLDAA